MFNIIMGAIMIITGALSIIFGNSTKFMNKKKIKDAIKFKKYLIVQRVLYTITGLCLVLIGRFTILNPLVDWQYNLVIALQLIFLLINFIINKKYLVINKRH